jgi:hypothetical protein
MPSNAGAFIDAFSITSLLVAIFAFLNFSQAITLAATTVGCGEYWGGDWTVSSLCTVTDETMGMSKNLLIQGTGTLELKGTTNLLFGFKYRKSITVSNPGADLSNYTMPITLDTATLVSAGKLKSDCSDLRFGDSETGAIYGYPYWIEPGTCNSASTRVWVKVTTIPAVSKTIYVFYGNPTAPAASDGDKTFLFFDDFNSANTAKFTYGGTYCGYNAISYSVGGGNLTVWSDNTWRILGLKIYNVTSGENVTVVTAFNASAASNWMQNYFTQRDTCSQNRYGLQDNTALGWRAEMVDGIGTSYSSAITTLSANTWYVDEIRRNYTGCFRSKIYSSAWSLLGSQESCKAVWAPVTWTWSTLQYQATQMQFGWLFISKATPREALDPTASVNAEESNLPQQIYIYSGGKLYVYPPAGINKP